MVSTLPITSLPNDDQWRLLRAEVEAFERPERAAFRALVVKTGSDGARTRLADGKVVAASQKRSDGMVEELTIGLIDAPFQQFVECIAPCDWSRYLAGLVGGDVQPQPGAIDAQGRTTEQLDRMVLKTMSSAIVNVDFWLFKHLDMTKNEAIDYGDTSVRVRWRVYHSDNATVAEDVGYVDFAGVDGGTRVTFHSAHRFTPSYARLWGWSPILGWQLRRTFSAHIRSYRARWEANAVAG